MNEHLKLTPAGSNLIKHFEGVKEKCGPDLYKPYVCPAGVLTIGWGSTHHGGHKFNEQSRWSMAECSAAFLADMETFERDVRKAVTVPLKPYHFDALVSFTYNVGSGNLNKSTLLKKINAGDFEGAAKEFHKWNKANGKVLAGLTRRRASESLLFQDIPDENYDGKPDKVIVPLVDPMPQMVDAPDDKT